MVTPSAASRAKTSISRAQAPIVAVRLDGSLAILFSRLRSITSPFCAVE